MSTDDFEVVIVGAGCSGSVFASVLARAGKKVCLIESGPDWQLTDLVSSEMWGRRIRPAGAPILLEGKNPMGYAGQAGLQAFGVDVLNNPGCPGMLRKCRKRRHKKHHREASASKKHKQKKCKKRKKRRKRR